MSIRSGESAPARGVRRFDLLTDVIEQVRLESTVFFTADFAAPWGISIVRDARSPFYAVTAGRCQIQLGRRAPRAVEAGDLLLLPSGAPHVVRSDPDAPIVSFEEWLGRHPMDHRGYVRHRGPGAVTRVTGGFFSAQALRGNPLFEALPPLIHLRGRDPHVQRWLRPTLAFIDAEIASDAQGSRTVLRRMADVLFIQAVRVFIARQDARARGWMRGLADRRIAHALTLIHEHYADPWTLDSLARRVGMSRTALAVRFKALVGESPMAYLLHWRITRAANALRGERATLTRAAEQVGFRSDAVFAKAFKRVTGESPGRFRRGAGPSASAV
jgi:AraC-like DNA-binding protein/mannose-6-phosphate isomerase-like protein (cupin superfamily)